MVSKEHKISIEAAAGTTRHITLTIPETLNIIREPAVLQARMSLWHHKVWTVEQISYRETQEKYYM